MGSEQLPTNQRGSILPIMIVGMSLQTRDSARINSVRGKTEVRETAVSNNYG
jgi:hypothetical protein